MVIVLKDNTTVTLTFGVRGTRLTFNSLNKTLQLPKGIDATIDLMERLNNLLRC